MVMIQVKNPYRLIDPFNIPLKEPEARDPNQKPFFSENSEGRAERKTRSPRQPETKSGVTYKLNIGYIGAEINTKTILGS